MAPPSPQATVVITTKNRKDELRRAVASALAQRGADIEVLVIDDGSTDGTTGMLSAEFPGVRVVRDEQSRGYIAQRNRGAQLAAAPVVFSIDDDAAFASPHTAAQTLAEFDHPRVGAVAIPYIDILIGPHVHQRAPSGPSGEREQGIYATDTYRGTAHALRRDVFLSLGGYRPHLFHQGEEGDYCARLLNAGYITRLGRADPIHHFESPRRDQRRVYIYAARNNLLYVWHNVPFPYAPFHWLATTYNLFMYGLRRRHPFWSLRGIAAGHAAAIRYFMARAPIDRAIYRLTRRLRRDQAVPLAEIEPVLAAAGI